MDEEFRVIPGYSGYCVSRNGVVKSIERNLILQQWPLDGYLIVDTFRGSLTETLPVHRAVALAWVVNPDPTLYNLVNHIDGVRANNWYENLEWTNCSGNNYHAINTGLRNDNIKCKIRDFYTGEIRDFNSIAQAADAMGLTKDTSIERLYPKMFGKLIANRYEFRLASDPNPWFYENRTELVPPSRYLVTVHHSDGQVREVYSTRVLKKEYQLYGNPAGDSIPALAQYGNKRHPDKQFSVRDGYREQQFRQPRATKPSIPLSLCATRGLEKLEFPSLTSCAKHFVSIDLVL